MALGLFVSVCYQKNHGNYTLLDEVLRSNYFLAKTMQTPVFIRFLGLLFVY